MFCSEIFRTYWHIIDLVNHAGLDDELYDSMMYSKVIEHMSNNKGETLRIFKEKMSYHNVEVDHIKP